MKRFAWLVPALILALLLTGCGRFVSILPGSELPQTSLTLEGGDAAEEHTFEERALLSFLGRDAFGESYYSDTPTALSYQPTMADGSSGCRAYVFDRASIIAACDALRGMTVVGRADEEPTGLTEYILTMPNGDEYDFSFGLLSDGATRVLSVYTGDYIVEGGDELFAIQFPAYSTDFDVFDLYFDSAIRAFADSFYDETPVSVGYRMNSGASISSTDPEAIEGVFRALANAEVIVVENLPDQNIDLTQTREYFFMMESGERFSFLFAQRCLVVTANAAFGPVYYWLSGTDELWNVEIMSDNGTDGFEGGTVADLRDDIGRASAVVDGTYDADLSVLGVFVEYSIGDESGYLTLDGETAEDFVRQAVSIRVSDETVESPDGDTVTVSVTLSDSSGPILYFTGDAIQQFVGMCYVCDGSDMSALRDEVLSLAAGGNNTAVVEEGGTD